MTPEDSVKQEVIDIIQSAGLLPAYIRLMQILDPDLYQIAQQVDAVRKHGHGQVTINVGKGKINSSTETLSHII